MGTAEFYLLMDSQWEEIQKIDLKMVSLFLGVGGRGNAWIWCLEQWESCKELVAWGNENMKDREEEKNMLHFSLLDSSWMSQIKCSYMLHFCLTKTYIFFLRY